MAKHTRFSNSSASATQRDKTTPLKATTKSKIIGKAICIAGCSGMTTLGWKCITDSCSFADFMTYPNLALKIALFPPFEWEVHDETAMAQKQTTSQSPPQLKSKQRFLFICALIFLLYPVVGMLIYFCYPPVKSFAYDTALGTAPHIFEMIGCSSYLLVGFINIFNLYWHRTRITLLLRAFYLIFPQDTPRHFRLRYYLDKSQRQMRRSMYFFIWTMLYFNMLPLLELIYECWAPDQEVHWRKQVHLWYPWETRRTLQTLHGYAITFVAQSLAAVIGMSYVMAGMFWFCFFVTQLQLHFDYLANALMALDASAPDASQQLKRLIAHHNRLLSLTHEMNSVFNITFLANLATSSVSISMMSMAALMISIIDGFKYASAVVFYMVVNYVFCYNGNEFTNASDRLRPAAFYSNWYVGNVQYQRLICFLIMRNRQSNVLRVYDYVDISMETYMRIIKFSYQLLTFFRTMNL